MTAMSSNVCKLIFPLWLTEAQLDFSFFSRARHNILEMYRNTLSIPILLEHFTIFSLSPAATLPLW